MEVVMEEKERYAEHTVAWELPTGDSVTKGNYNLADIETKYIPIQTEMISDDNDYQEKIQQLKQSQKQLAISELELVLNNFKNRPTYFDVARQELCLSDQDKQFIDFIDNQIKSLKGEE